MMRTLHAPGSWSRLAIVAALVLMPARLNGVPQSQTLRLREYIHSIYQDHDGAPLGRVDGILQTSEGYLWVFTSDGLLRFDGLAFPSPRHLATVAHIYQVTGRLDDFRLHWLNGRLGDFDWVMGDGGGRLLPNHAITQCNHALSQSPNHPM